MPEPTVPEPIRPSAARLAEISKELSQRRDELRVQQKALNDLRDECEQQSDDMEEALDHLDNAIDVLSRLQ